jgi:TRAP-type mannitol/chloroaromatic compound transport system permease large subunit
MAALPYLGLGTLVLILVFLWPPFVTWLPAAMSAK